ncbi:copper amine oxidase N-terminal domain-containing protein [Alicyclobacillus tolerans]|uniref:copper amine oxidase N-terminal domain-containing protein n=1 Tax=Alicyclobacillus tolerans TaxID=90970 RepID=UPI001F2490B8|nr:copper amine oxidase N-terminal domain-containing protein [Alicyclobacillus tolerans]MCF8564989.1 copper amine oxidase N-terminal domain-containing protein [Alicyclobacillus tolerans]
MKRNRVLAVFSASFALAGVLTSLPATANAASYYTYYPTAVQVNGSTVSTPGHITEKDPFGGSNGAVTSFLPIWYIDQALGKFNVKVSWIGTTGILNLTTPSGMTVNYPSAPRPVTINSGTMEIEINGKVVTYVPRISYYDEGSGGIITTFVPVYYLEKAIGYMGVQTGWNGVDWTMQYGSTTPPTQVTGSTPKLDAAIAFAKAVGLPQDTSGVNPYSDVPQSDWGYVHALTENYTWVNPSGDGATVAMNAPLLSADSSSKFGSADNVTASTIDRAFQIFNGLATGHDSYLPGGSVVGLGNATGLNAGLSTTSGNLTESDFATMSANLATIEKGYKSLGNGEYQLVYRPNPKSYWTTSVPASTYAQDWATAISTIDKTVVVSAKPGAYETKTIGLSDRVSPTGNYLVVAGVSSPEQYSVNGGSTWHTANGDIGYDSGDPANGGQATAPSYVLIKDTNGGGITVMYDYNNNAVEFGSSSLWYSNGQLIATYQ